MSPKKDGIGDEIYIGTILLELNRWGSPKTPTYKVSEWLDRFQEAGFDGMELWEYHATLAPPEELALLEATKFPVSVYNTYCDFDDASEADRKQAAEMIKRFRADGVKFNVGRDPALRGEYIKNLRNWSASLPEDCRLLCECHGGTIIQEPSDAAKFFNELGRERYQIIVHFPMQNPKMLRKWFSALESSITHAHVQMMGANNKRARLSSNPSHVKEALHIMREEGYSGSFTLEFTEGTREPDENMEDLWQAALSDLHFLRENI